MVRWLVSVWNDDRSTTYEANSAVELGVAAQHACAVITEPKGCLISLVSAAEDDSFEIQAGLWQTLRDVPDGVSVSLSINPNNSTVRSNTDRDGARKWFELTCRGHEGPFMESDSLSAVGSAIELLICRESPSEVWLGRWSQNGQFNIHLDQSVVQALAEADVDLLG